MAERFEVFLGEVFRRSFDGAWTNLPYHDETGMGFCPVVRFPFTNLDIHVRAFLEAAAEERTGAEWLSVWARADKIRAAYSRPWRPRADSGSHPRAQPQRPPNQCPTATALTITPADRARRERNEREARERDERARHERIHGRNPGAPDL